MLTSSHSHHAALLMQYFVICTLYMLTLSRDGEQSPGATLTSKEKLEIAKQLAKLGVDIIEAGFPAASPDDFEAVRTIAREVGNAVDEDGYVPAICGLSRCVVK